MLAVFQRMTQGVLAAMGEGSFLRGSVPCRVNIEHGVQVIGTDDNVVVERSVATIAREHDPKVGDTLLHPDGNFKLDALYSDNGVSRRFVLLKVA
jgi:hypothetical protein